MDRGAYDDLGGHGEDGGFVPDERPSGVHVRPGAAASLLEVLDRCPTAIVEMDARGEVLRANAAGASLLSRLGEAARGANLLGALGARDPALSAMAEREAEGTLLEGHTVALDTGELLSLSLVRLGGARLLAVLTDVSKPLAAERAAREAEGRTLRQLAYTDALTGLANRRRFLDAARGEIEAATAGGPVPAVVLVDCDHFKRVNDRHGHAAGDLVLAAIAQICRDEVRSRDVPARLGGEELVMLLPATTARGARRCAERIRRAVAALAVAVDGELVRCTVSAGVAEWIPGEDVDAWLAAADRALYAAKERGRNAVVVAGARDGQRPRVAAIASPASLRAAG